MRENFPPGLDSLDVRMGERLSIPRPGHQENFRAGRRDPVGMFVAVFDKGLIGDAQGVFFVIKMELIVRKSFATEPVFRSFLRGRIAAGDQDDLEARRQQCQRGFRARDHFQRAAMLGVE